MSVIWKLSVQLFPLRTMLVTANESVGRRFGGVWERGGGFVTANESVRRRFGGVGERGGGFCDCK